MPKPLGGSEGEKGMAKKVVSQTAIPHFCAFCGNCEWVYQNFLDRELGFSEIRKHVRKTGHTVTLEKGVHTIYSLESAPPNNRVQPDGLTRQEKMEALESVLKVTGGL